MSTTLQLVPESGLTSLARAVFPLSLQSSQGPQTSHGPAIQRSDARRARMLGEFQPTTLDALAAVSLLNRVDTKYLIPVAELPGMLTTLVQAYSVLDVDGQREHTYRTTYFDTPTLALYRDHHAGRAVRHKVRSRTYVDSGLSFFEIKTRTDAGRTVKYRLETASPLTTLTPAARTLLAAHLPPEEQALQPILRNDFRRITLVGLHTAERLTLDLGVQFEYEGKTAVLPGVVIAELKQSGIDRGSPVAQLMARRQIRPTSLSKYCVGVAMLLPHTIEQAFAAQLQAIQALAARARPVR